MCTVERKAESKSIIRRRTENKSIIMSEKKLKQVKQYKQEETL